MSLTQYTFRVDEVDGVTRESVISFLAELGCRHVVCREISDITKKPHYQGWVHLSCGQQTYANRIKKRWPSVCSSKRGRSSGHYSAAPVRKPTYEQYCLKGTTTELPDIVSMQLGPSESIDVQSIHRQWWSHQASASPRKTHLVEEGISVFSSYEWSCDNDDMIAKRAEVARWIIDKMKCRGLNSFLIKNYINGILCVTDSEYEKQYIDQIVYSERW